MLTTEEIMNVAEGVAKTPGVPNCFSISPPVAVMEIQSGLTARVNAVNTARQELHMIPDHHFGWYRASLFRIV